MNKKLAEHIQKSFQDKVTKEEILKQWGNVYLDYLVDILNKDYNLDEAIGDIKSFRGTKYEL